MTIDGIENCSDVELWFEVDGKIFSVMPGDVLKDRG